MNNKIKKLIAGGVITLSMLSCKTMVSDAMNYMYTTENVNLRQYAGTYSRKLGVVRKGTKIPVYGSYGNWYRVLVNGKWGYVYKDYINSSVINKNVTSNKGQVLKRLIIVNTYYNKIYLYQNGRLVWSRSCASGKYSTPTPVGKFSVVNKIVNPYYTKGNIKGGSPLNPLGKRWVGIGGSYGIHGNNNESSIGKKVSNGCIRLHNWDVIDFYSRVSVGDRVIISNRPSNNSTIVSMYGYKIY